MIDFDFCLKATPSLAKPSDSLALQTYRNPSNVRTTTHFALMASDMQLALCFASSDKKLKLNSAKHRGRLPKNGLGHQFGEVVNQNQMISQVGFFQDYWAIQNPRFLAIAHAQE